MIIIPFIRKKLKEIYLFYHHYHHSFISQFHNLKYLKTIYHAQKLPIKNNHLQGNRIKNETITKNKYDQERPLNK